MSATVTVGFAPASTPAIAAGLASTPAADANADDGGNPFAAFLALVGAAIAPTTEPVADAAVTPPVTFSVPQTAALPAIDLTDLGNAPALQSETGKSLLNAFSKALIAVKDALADGKPVDPTLEKKLQKTVDDLSALLGITLPQPVQTPFAPVIAAAASGDSLLPVGDTAPAPPIQQTPDLPEAATPIAADPTGDIFPAETSASANTGAVVPASIDTAEPVAAAPATETPVDTLARLVEDLGDKLQQQSPDLANKLKAVAEALSSGKVPTDLLAKIGLSTEPGKSAPELTQLIDALAAPASSKEKPAPVFTAPVLAAPTAVLPKGGANKVDKSAAQVGATATSGTATADSTADTTLAPTGPALDTNAAKSDKPADAKTIDATSASGTAHDATKSDKADKAAAANANTIAPDAAATSPSQVAVTNVVAGTRAIHAAYQAAVQQINLPQVAFEVARQVQAGNSRFQIRLDPAELGRIDVRLDVDKDGTVNARMFVERPETLDLMQRDQRALQQALQQAGLDGSKTSLEFSLRQNPFAGNPGGNGGSSGEQGFGPFGDLTTADATAEAAPISLYRGTSSASGVNLVV
ncbi:flagellar hook-length control protein FliK [Devosia sp.]|uniref:flagellar hook-length control protein FliK n=1 Tax=Devosia sp. TaxID=1871048 RepID=UPI003BAA1A48